VHRRQAAGDHDAHIDSVEARGSWAMVAFSWADSNEMRHHWAHALELRDGRILAMRDYANPASAALATRLRAALGT
jgi:ketosteroid isomerase-like protein